MLVQVEWAHGSPGVKPTRVTLQQLLDLADPGDTLFFVPGVYKSETPLRMVQPLVSPLIPLSCAVTL